MNEDDTTMMERNPLLKATIDYALKRVMLPMLTAGVVAIAGYEKEGHDEKWIGNHVKDKQNEIDNLENSVSNLQIEVNFLMEKK
jgi:hypothetical protein